MMDEREREAMMEGRLWRFLDAEMHEKYVPGGVIAQNDLGGMLEEIGRTPFGRELAAANARLEARIAGLEEWVRLILLLRPDMAGRALEADFSEAQEARIRGEDVPRKQHPGPLGTKPPDPGLP